MISVDNGYYEVMTAGNVLLPEDLLYMVVRFSDSKDYSGFHHNGLWGTAQGAHLRAWMRANRRPLLWADDEFSALLIDPWVGASLLVGRRITDSDVQLFDRFWTAYGLTPTSAQFDELVVACPARLKLTLPSWQTRKACAPADVDEASMVLGTDGDGLCVFWREGEAKWDSSKTKRDVSEILANSTSRDCAKRVPAFVVCIPPSHLWQSLRPRRAGRP